MRSQRRDAHGHESPLGRRHRADRGQELICPGSIDGSEQGLAALGEGDGPLTPILLLLVPLDEATANQPVDEAAGRRRRSAEALRQLTDGRRAAVREDVERRELGEPQPELAELGGEPDDELAPERPAHRDALRDLADVRHASAGGENRRSQVGLEPAGDRPDGRRAGSLTWHAPNGTGVRARSCAVVHRAHAHHGSVDPRYGQMTGLAFVFPGQGSQVVGMGRDLAAASPAAAAIFDAADAALAEPLSTLTWEGPADDLNQTENAQPALLATSMAWLAVLRERIASAGLPAPGPP